MHHDETTWFVRRLPPLSCCCADHSQLNRTLSTIMWGPFVHYGTRLTYNHLMYFLLPNGVIFLLKENLHAFYTFKGYFILLLVFDRFWEPNRHCAMYIDSHICDSSVVPNWSQTTRLYCKHCSTRIPASQALSQSPFMLL